MAKKNSQKGLLTKIIVMVIVAGLAGVIGAIFTFPAAVIGHVYPGMGRLVINSQYDNTIVEF